MDRSARFWDRFAERYARQPIADPETYEKKLRLTQAYLTPQARVLEFGCGTGSTALLHAPKVAHLLAVDYSQKMIDIANRKLAETALDNVEFRCATLFELDAQDASFDAVLGLNVLHLIEDYPASIRKAYELLKPGGVLVTSTVCLSAKWPKLILPLGAALGLIPKVQLITVDALETAMTDCGFTVVEKLPPKSATGAVFLIVRK